MGETAEERARRLALQNNAYVNAMNVSTTIIRFGRWSNDVLEYGCSLDDYEQMIVSVREEPNVSLVKKYSKGSFKFV